MSNQPYLYIPVGGTRVNPFKGQGSKLEWRNNGSPWSLFARHYGFWRVDLDDDPTTRDKSIWSRAVNGLFLQALYGGHKRHWKGGGLSLLEVQASEAKKERERAETFKRSPRPILWCLHSHAGNCAFCALEDQRTLEDSSLVPAALISLDMPVSRMMGDCYQRVRDMHPNLPIIHLYSTGVGWHSRFRWLGSHFNDEQLSVADKCESIGETHGAFLRDPQHLGQWARLWPMIRQAIDDKRETSEGNDD